MKTGARSSSLVSHVGGRARALAKGAGREVEQLEFTGTLRKEHQCWKWQLNLLHHNLTPCKICFFKNLVLFRRQIYKEKRTES